MPYYQQQKISSAHKGAKAWASMNPKAQAVFTGLYGSNNPGTSKITGPALDARKRTSSRAVLAALHGVGPSAAASNTATAISATGDTNDARNADKLRGVIEPEQAKLDRARRRAERPRRQGLQKLQ